MTQPIHSFSWHHSPATASTAVQEQQSEADGKASKIERGGEGGREKEKT